MIDFEKEINNANKPPSTPLNEKVMFWSAVFVLLVLAGYSKDADNSDNFKLIFDSIISTLLATILFYKGLSDAKRYDTIELNWLLPIPSKIWCGLLIAIGVGAIIKYFSMFSLITIPISLVFIYYNFFK